MKSKAILVVVIVLTVLVGGAGVYIAYRMQTRVASEESEAAGIDNQAPDCDDEHSGCCCSTPDPSGCDEGCEFPGFAGCFGDA